MARHDVSASEYCKVPNKSTLYKNNTGNFIQPHPILEEPNSKFKFIHS